MDRLILLIAVAAVASGLALLLQRRRPDAPVRTGWIVPEQLDRDDFEHPDAPWLVAVFTSDSCDSCDCARKAGPTTYSIRPVGTA